MDVDDENKYVKSTGNNLCFAGIAECVQTEYSYESGKALVTSKLERRIGECIALETNWVSGAELIPLLEKQLVHNGKVHVTNKEIIGPELPHEHYKADNDSPEYWEDIL
jgi:hypothetical protein